MLTESPVMMRPPPVDEDLEEEIGLILRDQRNAIDRERELNIFRSGSAPPIVDGSIGAVKGGLLLAGDSSEYVRATEEELRADPAYLEYYYSNVKLNPRFPPPVLSKEDWRFTQRLQMGSSAFGRVGDRRKGEIKGGDGDGRMPLFGEQSKFGPFPVYGGGEATELAASGEWVDRGGDGLIGLPGMGVGSRQKSFAGILQDDLGHTAAIQSHPSRPANKNAFNNAMDIFDSDEKKFSYSCNDLPSISGIESSENGHNASSSQSVRQTPRTFSSVLSGSQLRTSSHNPQLLKRIPSPSLPPVGAKIGSKDGRPKNDLRSFASVPVCSSDSADIVGAFSGLKLSQNNLVAPDVQLPVAIQQQSKVLNNYPSNLQDGNSHARMHSSIQKSDLERDLLPSISKSADLPYLEFGSTPKGNQNNLYLTPDGHNVLHNSGECPSNSYLKFPNSTSTTCSGNSPSQYQKSYSAESLLSSYAQSGFYGNSSPPQVLANQVGTSCLPPLFEDAARMSAIGYPGLDSFDLGSISSGRSVEDLHKNAMVAGLQMPFVDPFYLQYLNAEYTSQISPRYNDLLMDRDYPGNSYLDALGLLKAHIGTLPSPDKQGYYGNPNLGLTTLAMSYPGASIANPVCSATFSPGSPIRHSEKSARYPIGMHTINNSLMGSWHPDAMSNYSEGFPFTLLDEFKSNKTRSFELFEIAGHVVEFSADQYGSRFIQQKLETASIEEKNMVYEEIIPQALSLMTDVFGNYVIQKFFEHGIASQIRELANQLIGHVLTLSLQMYGCRVIQKAIEVVELDQQMKMVAELDGHIMQCVRDQNGNHVIQKCIECIPQNAIQFIISAFYGQVVNLSTHPYGCRVIQRVLEHCDDSRTQQIVMDEIFECVCMLARDQYGNYVVQHILEHGNPDERSAIIKKLAGQIVQMSQQKFASNVIEKCLSFGGADERKILVNEMLGTTDENEPLQAMMKDQFANYVVQKVLETCDDQQRELILSRIKVHLSALKKYTYGKHIVARVEKLVAAGERRLGLVSFPLSA